MTRTTRGKKTVDLTIKPLLRTKKDDKSILNEQMNVNAYVHIIQKLTHSMIFINDYQ